MRYGDLTTERSLLENDQAEYTGGRVVVIGKVVRVFDSPRAACRGPARACPPPPAYTDYATQEIWRAPLEQASNYLIDHVSHRCQTRRTRAEIEEDRSLKGEVAGRARFLTKLTRQTQLYAPGAVFLPLAVYK